MPETGLSAGLQRGWDSHETVEHLREDFADAILAEESFREERTVIVSPEKAHEVLAALRDDERFAYDYLTDVTAVHWPDRAETPFEVVYTLYSFPRQRWLRVKAALGADPRIKSATPLWPGADWLERECFDMFGVVFEGHPDLRRILMTEDFDAYPLRKEFPLKC
jgi:NADH-quinone oxidoreductase subunit C